MTTTTRLVLMLLLLSFVTVRAETFTGKVVRVLDGDTAEVLDGTNTVHRVRFSGIDAPEKGQPFGMKAKEELLGLIGGRVVDVEWHKLDVHQRLVGKVTIEGRDAGLAMVRAGLAWWYVAYAKEQERDDRALYEAAEAAARAGGLGLWFDPAPVAPWDFRHAQKAPGPVEACPCETGGVLCTGPKGGRFCVTELGVKRYQSQSGYR